MTLTHIDGSPVSHFAFGTMQWGADSTADADATFAACRAAGITHFDTAYVYQGGASERHLGRLAAAERDSLFIATKAAYDQPSTARNIRASVDESCKRLGMEVIDLLYLHRFDPTTPLDESFEALAALQEAGAIRHIGVSNFAAWQVVKANAIAKDLGTQIDAIQPMYNLVKRQAEVEILPMAADQGIEVCTYSPLGGGLLTGKYARGQGGRLSDDHRYNARYGEAWMHAAAEGLVALAEATGTDAATLAVAWLKHHAPAVRPILSGRNVDQLAPSLAAIDHRLDDDLFQRITALSRRPAPATDRLEEA